MINKPKKKHNWMSGFVITKPLSEAEIVSIEITKRSVDSRNKRIKNGR